MAHFARIENNIVTQVIVVNNQELLDENNQEQESLGIAFCKSLFGENTQWRQTSYNRNLRKNFAGIGYTFNEERDDFVAPQPYDSWNLNLHDGQWYPPVSYPNDGKAYYWDETTLSWIQIETEETTTPIE